MRKIYIFMALVLACISQAVAKEIEIGGLYDADKRALMEFRDGGADGTPLTLEYKNYSYMVDVENGLWIHCTNPEASLTVSTYDSDGVHYKDIEDQSCFYTMEELENVSRVSIDLSAPRYVTMDVEDPDVIIVRKEKGGEPVSLEKGSNRVRLTPNDGFYIEVADPDEYKLTRFYNVKSNEDYRVTTFYSSYVSSWDVKDGDIYGYEVVPAADFKMPVVLVRVDEPQYLNIRVDGGSVSDLEANEWKEIPLSGQTGQVTLSHKDYGEELYMVKQNDEVLPAPTYGTYYVDVMDGDKIDIIVAPEDIDYTVSVAVDPEVCVPVIKSVEIAKETVENKTGEFTVTNGQKIKLNLDTDLYTLKGIEVNDKEVDISSVYYSFTYKVTGDTKIVVKAEAKPTFSVILDIDNPQAVDVSFNYNTVELKPGENELNYLADKNRLVIKKKLGATIDYLAYVKDDVETEIENPSDSHNIYLDESYTKVIIRVTPLKLDKQFVAYFDIDQETVDKFFAGYSFGSFSFYSDNAGMSYRTKINPGYNVYDFADVYLPYYWSFSIYDDEAEELFTEGACYVDGELLEMGYSSWTIDNLEDKSVVKCYITKDPQTFSATLSADDDADFTVIKDRIVPVEDLTAPITDLEDTEIELIPAEGKDIDVYVSGATRADEGEKLVADENGHFIVRLDSDKSVSVKNGSSTGIGAITADAEAEGIYTMTGICISRKADKVAVDALPAGVYVIGGKKVVKK